MARTKKAARKNNKRKEGAGGDDPASAESTKSSKKQKKQHQPLKSQKQRLEEHQARQAAANAARNGGAGGGGGGGAGSSKKKKEKNDRSRSRSASRGRSAPPSSNKKESNFLSEEELFACYYALPKTPADAPSAAFLQRLHTELASYNAAHVPSAAMTSSRWNLIAGVRGVARELWGNHVDVLPFGSFVTGLYLESSDVDLVVMHVSFGKKQIAVLLRQLGNRLRSLGLAKDVTLIPSARVPLLKYTDVATGLPVDISMGIMDGVLSANLMSRLSSVFPTFRPLTLFLKAFMQSLGLADVFKGGISSYILQVMILFHIQSQEVMNGPNGAMGGAAAAASSSAAAAAASSSAAAGSSSSSTGPLSPTSNLGYLLFTFFELFGCTFDYATHGIRISDGKSANGNGASAVSASAEVYLKRSTPGRFQGDRPYLLSMEDPIQKERDIGSACFGIRRIQRCFALAREFLCREPAPSAENNATANFKAGAAAFSPEKAGGSSEFTIDTVGNAAAAGEGAAASAAAHTTAAASSAAAAPSAAAAATAAPSSSSSNFSSSFGFILSSLLSLPVRYTIPELKRAAIKQPGWNNVVAKLERIEKLKQAKEAKHQRVAARHEAEAKKHEAKLRKQKQAAAAAASAESIDLTAGGESADDDGASSSETDDEEEADDDEVEILEAGAFGTSRKPIPIDDLELEGDEAEDGEEDEEAEDADDDAAKDGRMEGQEVPAVAAAASDSASAASAPSPAAAAAAAPVDPDSLPIDGDAMLLSNEHDSNMELNFK